MKWSRILLLIGAAAMVSCSSPTNPRLPQPEDERPPPPDSPGVVALGLSNPLAAQLRVG